MSNHPYDALQPDTVLDAVESQGFRCNGQLLGLNSYENRVYQIGIEDNLPLIAKFYRPQRWSDAAILEEHAFGFELDEREIPVVPPLKNADNVSLFEHAGFRFALFRRQGGRAPELDNEDNLRWLGRFLARIHAVGKIERYRHRPRLDIETFGRAPQRIVQASGMLADYLKQPYKVITDLLLQRVEVAFDMVQPLKLLRLHGDCHPGNILWTEHGPHFVDLDDSRMGPAVQDLWMLLNGEAEERERQLGWMLEGYREFSDFDPTELVLIEPLRSLRLIHYAGWLTSRWTDPAFPRNFPWFNTPRYWEEHIQTLQEQLARMDEPVMRAY